MSAADLAGIAAVGGLLLLFGLAVYTNIRHAAWTVLGGDPAATVVAHRRARPLALGFVGGVSAGVALDIIWLFAFSPGAPPAILAAFALLLWVAATALLTAALPVAAYMAALLRAGGKDPARHFSTWRSFVAGVAYVVVPSIAPAIVPQPQRVGIFPLLALGILGWVLVAPPFLGVLSAWLHHPLARRRGAGGAPRARGPTPRA